MSIENLNFRQLNYFREVAKTESINRAAENLMVSPPAVFSIVKRIEKEVGYPLFDRVGRNIMLNSKGKEFVTCIEKMFDMISNIEGKLGKSTGAKLRLGAINPIAFTNILERMIRRFPQMMFEHSVVSLSQLRNVSVIRGFDMIFAASGDFISPNWDSKILHETFPCLVIPRDHPMADASSLDLADINELPFIFPQKGFSIREYIDTLFTLSGTEPHIIAECNYNVLSHMLQENMGVTISTTVSKTWEQYKEMEYIPIRRPELKRFLAIYWNRSSCSTNPLLENIVKFITENPEM
ncbi:MAG: LysR family transcriptional regulator [Eubacteriales bacterium]|nr:LysR family transcriptional regulator [Eubacteriales bacterium]